MTQVSAVSSPANRAQIFQAAAWMMGAVIAFSVMAVAGREVSSNLDTFEIMTYRSLIGLALIGTIVALTGRRNELSTKHPGTHLIRNIFHFTGQNLWFYALPLIPLAQLFALEFTTPLWILLLSPLFLGERLTAMRAVCAVVGFIGILVVARPSPETANLGTLTAALAAIGFAGSIMATKSLTRSDSLLCILFWMTLMQSVFGLICAGLDGQVALPSVHNLPWVIAIALGGLVAHTCITSALSLAPATVISPLDFTRLPVIAVVGLVFYHEPIDALVMLGAILIFGANYLNLWSETRIKRHI